MIAGNKRATMAKQQGHRHGYEDRTEFLCEFFETLALNDFKQDSYFEEYVKHMEDRCQACIEGKDLELVVFQLPVSEEDDQGSQKISRPWITGSWHKETMTMRPRWTRLVTIMIQPFDAKGPLSDFYTYPSFIFSCCFVLAFCTFACS